MESNVSSWYADPRRARADYAQASLDLGVPHATLEDDEFQGGYIPKGTTVLANI